MPIILSKPEAEKVMTDIKKFFNKKGELTFKEIVDFMTRKRINATYLDKGFVDPLISQCCQLLNEVVQTYDMTSQPEEIVIKDLPASITGFNGISYRYP